MCDNELLVKISGGSEQDSYKGELLDYSLKYKMQENSQIEGILHILIFA